jgi:hypothetical protein
MKTGEALWDRFLSERNKFDAGGKSMMVLSHSIGLLREALKSYDSSSPNATALLCRATVETAGYLFLTRRKGPGALVYDLDPPRTLAGAIREVSFEEIKGGLVRTGVLSDTLLAAVSRIQVDGNFVAHLAAKQDRELDRAFTELHTKVKLGDFSPAISRMEISQDEARQDLEDTVETVLAIGRGVIRQFEESARESTRSGTRS